jgi:chemotaxis family two-component system response regulator Rcp1
MLSNPFRILAIEDHEPDVELIRAALDEVGLHYELITAEDGNQALIFVQSATEEEAVFVPDLVLLDLHLPNVSGFAVLQAIRQSQRLRNVAVIVVSGSRCPVERSRIEQLGAEMFWPKSTNETGFLDLAEAIKAVAEGFPAGND